MNNSKANDLTFYEKANLIASFWSVDIEKVRELIPIARNNVNPTNILRMLLLIYVHPRVTKGELKNIYNTNQVTVYKMVNQLVAIGLVKEVGRPRYVPVNGIGWRVDLTYMVTQRGKSVLMELL